MNPENTKRLSIEALRHAARCQGDDGCLPHADALESGDLRIVEKEIAECHCQQPQEPIVGTKTNTAWGRCEHGNIMEFVYPGVWDVVTDPSHAYAVTRILTQEPRRLALEKVAAEVRHAINSPRTSKDDFVDSLTLAVKKPDLRPVRKALAELDALNGDQP